MKLIIKLFGILLLLSGFSLLIKPEIILTWLEHNMESTFLYLTAIVVRLVIGLLLIITGKESKYPGVIKFFGYLLVVSAVVFIFIGHETFQNLMILLIPDFKPFAPVSGLSSIAIGGFFIYAFLRNKKLNLK